MSSPTKEELPRIDDCLKNELVGEHKLKHTETQEKVVLPSKTEIEQEKGQQQLLKSIETFEAEKLHHAKTEEKNPLPTKEVIEAEKKALA
ncbi:thymosin beta cib [Dermatophagoides pteronyssinus]|uniref:Thymosin beta-like n=2 Tax=Dermatophagoides pteronyssinus TaxID=6956 RepID=A0A6P6Y5S2_DERPT|nr:thymosin beta-like [Dermatophagoides pteronyssinus]KAH9419437.1 hypothetical protein DERP_010649 [Dermatophagoides pteronyssinus]